MKDMVLSLFGPYEPVVNIVDETEVVVSGMAGVDWPWVLTVLLFAIVLYSFFRLVGVLLRG